MSARLDGKIAVITGAAKGIGRRIGEEYIAAGATVVLSDIDGEAVAATAQEIGAAGGIACDVRSEADVKGLIETVVADHGALHIAVPNAGVGHVQPIATMSLEDWHRTTAVNFDGVFLTIRHSAPAIAAAGGGAVVTIASATATGGSPLLAPYAASKAGIVNLTRTAAVEFRDHGVRCNSILPGFIETDLVMDRKKDFEEGLGLEDFDAVILQKQGRYGTTEDVAKLALWLASDRSSWCTGGAYGLDGGLTASLL